MDKKWLLGFIEGSGCFSIVIRKSSTTVGYQTIADFTLKLPASQRDLLEKIQKTLKVGRLYENGDEVILKATKLSDARALATFFTPHSFVSEAKKKEFANWKKCVSLMNKGSHTTKNGLLEIARLRDALHTKNLWNKKNYCDLRVELDPCHVYQKTHSLPEGCRICWNPREQLVKVEVG